MSETQLSTELITRLLEQLEQALLKIQHCVSQLSEEQVWHKPNGSENSIGNLILHLEGNLRQWGIVPLTAEVDTRDRAAEFAHSVVLGREKLLGPLQETVDECRRLWVACDETRLLQGIQIQGFNVSCCEAVLHTTSHFVGHTHQIIMLTRQMLGEGYRFHWTPDTPREQLPI